MEAKVQSALGGGFGAPAADARGALGKDDFMKLLLAQLGSQDPLNPMDSHAFVAQLAQFATVELLQAQASGLETLVLAQASSNQLQAASLVGKDVSFTSPDVTLGADGQPVPLHAQLSGAASTVTVTIVDASGKTVRTLDLGGHAAGPLTASWDGRDDSGRPLPAGVYTVRVAASDVTGANVPADVRGRGKISAVSFENGFPELLIGSRRIKLADISQIHDSAAPPEVQS